LSHRPLTASDADGDLFADRVDALASVERALDLGLNVYVAGPSGSGRTSFLRRIEAGRESTAFVNLARVTSLDGLIGRLAATLDPATNSSSMSSQFFPALEDKRRAVLKEQGADQLGVLRKAVATADASGCTMLLDNVGAGLLVEFFGRQRDELWEVPLRWVVVGDASALEAPADTFFDTFLTLEPFGPDVMRDLLVRRARHTSPEQQKLMQQVANTLPTVLGSATPRRVISTARAVILDPDPESHLKHLREQEYSRLKLSATARLVLDALYACGPAHAGNEQLLKQVGTTRSRVVQVLKELEEVGLVRSFRAGKRKLYAPAPGDSRPRGAAAGTETRTTEATAEARR